MILAANPAREELRWLDRESRTPRLRTRREFAEQEWVIPEGKYKDHLWRANRQPAFVPLMDAMDDPWWREFDITGCVQSGKSLHGLALPTMYHLFEIAESIVFFAPTMDMAKDKWRTEIIPSINASRYKALMPTTGRGSRGGAANLIHLGNGADVWFMAAGGGDHTRSSVTARVAIGTEVDKMDTASATSRETDPVTQILNRAGSWKIHERRAYLECTVSIETGRIWKGYTKGTHSRLVVPCPHCQAWITPEREHLAGLDQAKSAIQAEETCWFFCPACGQAIDDKQRNHCNQKVRLIHRGQSIAAGGTVDGDRPETHTFGFRMNAFNNLFWDTPTIAAGEWEAAQDPDDDDKEKERRQFYWSVPWNPPEWDETPLDPHVVAQRKDDFPQSVLPPDTESLAIGVDIGKRQSWFLAMARRGDGRFHIPDYGIIEVHSDDMPVGRAILLALREFGDSVEAGYAMDGSTERRIADRVWIDVGYQQDAVFAFLAETTVGRTNRYMAARGRGLSQHRKAELALYKAPDKTTSSIKMIGPGWHLARVPKFRSWEMKVNADHYKLELHQGLAIEMGQPGAVGLFTSMENLRHNKLSRHLTSEKLVIEEKPGKGRVERWDRNGGANHWLDCAYNAKAALNFIEVLKRRRKTNRPAPGIVTPAGYGDGVRG